MRQKKIKVKIKEIDKSSYNYFLDTLRHKPELKIKHILPFITKSNSVCSLNNFWINALRGGET